MEDMLTRADFMKWALVKFLGSERRGEKNTCTVELASAFDVEYTLMNQLLFISEDDGEEEGGKDSGRSGGTSGKGKTDTTLEAFAEEDEQDEIEVQKDLGETKEEDREEGYQDKAEAKEAAELDIGEDIMAVSEAKLEEKSSADRKEEGGGSSQKEEKISAAEEKKGGKDENEDEAMEKGSAEVPKE